MNMSGQNIGDLSEILANRYQCDRRLGKQAGRQTLLARDLKTQQQVVVKLLSYGSGNLWIYGTRTIWRALKNPRPTDKNSMAVQWQGSDIKLTKTSEFIEIIIPPQGVGFGLIALLLSWIAANIRLLIEFVDGRTYPPLNIISIICLVTVKQGLSKSEIEWLASELIQWLRLKIKTTLTDKVDE
jgi:hypothetical protein